MRKCPSAAVLVFLLCAAVIPPAMAQQLAERPRIAPDAGWHEKDYLLHYAIAVCVRGAYGTLTPAPGQVLEALDQEAWAMIEFTRQAPETYDYIHGLADAYGKAEAPQRALSACGSWVMRESKAILKTSTERQ